MNTSVCKDSHAISSCRLTSAKSERDIHLRSASNLTKQDLEDNNYKLLEANVELKKTINEQQNQIKVLTTKLLRITSAQKNYLKKEQKECCAASKTIIQEQNNCIEDLKLSNSRLSEKVRALNVRVCSNKQFLAKGGNFHHCSLCSAHPSSPYSVKLHRSTAALSISSARSEFKIRKKNNSLIDLHKTFADAETLTTDSIRKDNERSCNENKCKTLIEELKHNNLELVQQIQLAEKNSTSHISKLEAEIARLQTENAQVRANLRIKGDDYEEAKSLNKELYEKITKSDALCCELKYQLAIEKKKVFELETEVKAAAFSSEVAKTIENHLLNRSAINDNNLYSKTTKELNLKSNANSSKGAHNEKDSVSTISSISAPPIRHRLSVSDKSTSVTNLDLKDNIKPNNDDSGFADPEVEEQICQNEELRKSIIALQIEIKELKLTVTKSENKNKNSVSEEETRNTSNEQWNMADSNKINDKIIKPNVSKNNSNHSSKLCTESHIPIPAKRKINENKKTNTKTLSAEKEKISERKEHDSIVQKENDKDKSINQRGVNKFELTNTKKINKTTDKRKDNSTNMKSDVKIISYHETNILPDHEKDNPPITFTVSNKDKAYQTSPDDTEYEISSISDSPRNILSPGEKRFTVTQSTSYTTSDSWDLAGLSEGELPHVNRGRHLSIGENPDTASYTSKKDIDHEDVKIEDTLKEISQELARCKHLLRITSS